MSGHYMRTYRENGEGIEIFERESPEMTEESVKLPLIDVTSGDLNMAETMLDIHKIGSGVTHNERAYAARYLAAIRERDEALTRLAAIEKAGKEDLPEEPEFYIEECGHIGYVNQVVPYISALRAKLAAVTEESSHWKAMLKDSTNNVLIAVGGRESAEAALVDAKAHHVFQLVAANLETENAKAQVEKLTELNALKSAGTREEGLREAAGISLSMAEKDSDVKMYVLVSGKYRFSVSEGGDSEHIATNHILREIHDAMCMCGVWDDCDTDGINGTLVDAAQGLLVEGKWHHDFEDGWISVEGI